MKNKKDLGALVASEMDSILKSDEYRLLFNKNAAEKCKCDCEKCKEMGSHSDCVCVKEEKKSEASTLCKCDCEECKEAGKHSEESCDCAKHNTKEATFEGVIQSFVSLSADLDELDLEKTASSVLNLFDDMLKEAAELTISEEEAERALENAPVEIVTDEEALDPNLVHTMDPDLEQMSPDELEGEIARLTSEDPSKERPLSDDFLGDIESMSLEELLAMLQQSGEDRSGEEHLDSLIEEGKSEYLPEEDVDVSAFASELDSFLIKNADENLFSRMDSDEADFDLDAELKELDAEFDLASELTKLAEESDEEEEEEDFEDED